MIPRKYQEEAAQAAFDSEKNTVVVMPTGSGKSLVICMVINKIMSADPTHRIVVLSHVQEILEQDYAALSDFFEGIDIGLYSKGLGSDTIEMITVAGIQSVYNRPEIFSRLGKVVVIIDEAHMVPMRENSMYRKFLAHFTPDMAVTPDNGATPDIYIGLTPDIYIGVTPDMDATPDMDIGISNAKLDGPKLDGPKLDGPKLDGPKLDGPKLDGPKLAPANIVKPKPPHPIKIIGLTATHFRLGHGYIHKGPGAIFNEICYDLSNPVKFKQLQDDGYLSKLITKATLMGMDRKGLKTTAGDFNIKSMAERFDRDGVTNTAVDEIILYGKNYKKWLVFAIDISHAEHITSRFIERGVSAVCVHSKMDRDRKQTIRDIKAGKYRCIVNVDILTTGFDVPDIDLIAMLRQTKSPVIHVQAIGRGLRVAPGKDHCLVLDFAGNTEYLGPIDNVVIEQKGPKTGKGEPIMKKCRECLALSHPSVKECPVCGYQFLFKHGLDGSAGVASLTTDYLEDWCTVDSVDYSILDLKDRPSALKVTYCAGLNRYSEIVFLDNAGYAKATANSWVKYRTPSGKAIGSSLVSVYQNSHLLKTPKAILVKLGGKWPKIIDMVF